MEGDVFMEPRESGKLDRAGLLARIKELEAERDDAESAWLRTLEDLGQAEQTNADLLAALEEAKVRLSAVAFGSWAPEEMRPEMRVTYEKAAAAIAAAKGEGLTVTAPERVYRIAKVAPNVFEDITYEEVVEQARIRAAIAKAKGDTDD